MSHMSVVIVLFHGAACSSDNRDEKLLFAVLIRWC